MKHPIPAHIFLGLFAIASILQLIFAFIENEKLRRKEKSFCLLFLALFAVFAFPDKPLICIGALFGLAGDILDLSPKTFVIGVVCFYLGHLCYIFEIIYQVFNFVLLLEQWLALITTNLVVTGIMLFFCIKFSNHSTLNTIGQSMYFAILVTYIPLLIFAVIDFGKMMIVPLVGSLLFIASDSLLGKTHFGRKFKRYNFYVMLTYLLAEFLIVFGLVLFFAN